MSIGVRDRTGVNTGGRHPEYVEYPVGSGRSLSAEEIPLQILTSLLPLTGNVDSTQHPSFILDSPGAPHSAIMGMLYLPAGAIYLDIYDQCLDLQPMKTWEHRWVAKPNLSVFRFTKQRSQLPSWSPVGPVLQLSFSLTGTGRQQPPPPLWSPKCECK